MEKRKPESNGLNFVPLCMVSSASSAFFLIISGLLSCGPFTLHFILLFSRVSREESTKVNYVDQDDIDTKESLI